MKRILLVKLGPIGDVVMATPVIEAAARLWPEAQITWVVTASLAPLLARLRPAPEIITVDDTALWRGSTWQRLRLLAGLRRRLAGRHFDLGLFGHANPRLRALVWGLPVGIWRSFRLGITRPHPLPGRRHHDEHVRLLTGVDGPEAQPAAYPAVELRPPQPELPAGPCVVLVPGGARNPLREDRLRRWPVGHYAALARLLQARGISVILSGGPEDEWVRPAFAGLATTDLIGQTTIDGALDLYAACAAVVAHDSGPMHLADLAGTAVVALFGPTSPHEKAPIGARSRVLWGGEHLPCRPCYDGIAYADCARNRCLEEVTPEAVFTATLAACSLPDSSS